MYCTGPTRILQLQDTNLLAAEGAAWKVTVTSIAAKKLLGELIGLWTNSKPSAGLSSFSASLLP